MLGKRVFGRARLLTSFALSTASVTLPNTLSQIYLNPFSPVVAFLSSLILASPLVVSWSTLLFLFVDAFGVFSSFFPSNIISLLVRESLWDEVSGDRELRGVGASWGCRGPYRDYDRCLRRMSLARVLIDGLSNVNIDLSKQFQWIEIYFGCGLGGCIEVGRKRVWTTSCVGDGGCSRKCESASFRIYLRKLSPRV